MWPMKLDMTRDECRGILRRLELESYSSVVNTFRAQGALCKNKSRILEELRKIFHISQDRHKAEARRVANDEKLATVAETMCGPNTNSDWTREGRRLFPILPRTSPYTALSYVANSVSDDITKENTMLPHPSQTKRAITVEPDEDIPPKPVVVSDPLLQNPYNTHIASNNDLKRALPKDEPAEEKEEEENDDISIKEESSQSDANASPSSSKKRGQLYQQLQSPQKPIQHTNNRIQQLYHTHTKTQTRNRKAGHVKKGGAKGRPSHSKAKTAKSNAPSTSKAANKAAIINNTRLIHSYASPMPCDTIPTENDEANTLQLQKHLTFNNINYQPQQAPIKGQVNPIPQAVYNSYQILPSSKKDIQYNLTKLNPVQANAAGQMNELHARIDKRDSNDLKFNFNKISAPPCQPSTSSAISPPLHSTNLLHKSLTRKDEKMNEIKNTNIIIRNELDDVTALSAVQQKISNINTATQQIPDPKIIFSTSVNNVLNNNLSSSCSSTIINFEETTPQTSKSTLTSNTVKLAAPTQSIQIKSMQQNKCNVKIIHQPPTITGSVGSNKMIIKPSLSGFTPIKSANKLSVHKLQLMPLNQVNSKNNVILMSPKTPMNQGQKVNLPKNTIIPSVVDIKENHNTTSVEQPQTDGNKIVVFDICSEQKHKATPTILSLADRNMNKTVITEDTPVDIISTPIEVINQTLTSPSTKTVKNIVKHIKSGSVVPLIDNSSSSSSSSSNKKFRINKNNHVNNVQSSKTVTVTSNIILQPPTVQPIKNVIISTTDWEHELDQANATHLKTSQVVVQKTVTPEHMIMDDEQHFNAVIEEDDIVDDGDIELEPNDAEDEDDVMNMSYVTSTNDLIADLESDDDNIALNENMDRPETEENEVDDTMIDFNSELSNKIQNAIHINPTSLNFEQYIEDHNQSNGQIIEADINVVDDDDGDDDENEISTEISSNEKVMFEMLEIDSDGNKHTRRVSYDEVIKAGHIITNAIDSSEPHSTSAYTTIEQM